MNIAKPLEFKNFTPWLVAALNSNREGCEALVAFPKRYLTTYEVLRQIRSSLLVTTVQFGAIDFGLENRNCLIIHNGNHTVYYQCRDPNYGESLSLMEFRFAPVPGGQVVLLQSPYCRQGPHKIALPALSWTDNLRRLLWCSVQRVEAHIDNRTVMLHRSDNPYHSHSKNTLFEKSMIDMKCFQASRIQPSKIVEKMQTEMIPLLNSVTSLKSKASMVFGVDDKTGDAIGHSIQGESLNWLNLTKRWFPALNQESVSVLLNPVSHCNPHTWALLRIFVVDSDVNAMKIFLACQGRGCVIDRLDLITQCEFDDAHLSGLCDFTASLTNPLWLLCDGTSCSAELVAQFIDGRSTVEIKKENLISTFSSWQQRFIITVTITIPENLLGCFAVRNSEYGTVLSDTNEIKPLMPAGVWLRLHSQPSMSPNGFIDGFVHGGNVHILITRTHGQQCYVANAVSKFLNQPMDFHLKFDTTDIVSPSQLSFQLRSLVHQRTRTQTTCSVVIEFDGSDSQVRVINEILIGLFGSTPPNPLQKHSLILALPFSALYEVNILEECVKFNSNHWEVCDVFVTSLLLPPSVSMQNSEDERVDNIFLPVPPPHDLNTFQDFAAARNWFLQLAPLSWDLVKQQLVVKTVLAHRAENHIRSVLAKPILNGIKVVTLHKTWPGVGATTLLHILAASLQDIAEVRMVDAEAFKSLNQKQTREEYWAVLLRQASSSSPATCGRMVIFADESVYGIESFVKVFPQTYQKMQLPIPVRIVIVHVQAHITELVGDEIVLNPRLIADVHHGFHITPFLSSHDIHQLCEILKRCAGEDKDVVNALSLAEQAALDHPNSFGTHIFIFILTFTRGQYQPAETFVDNVVLQIGNNQLLLNAAKTIAFMEIFSPQYQLLNSDLRDISASGRKVLELITVAKKVNRVSFLHPFLAQIFLQQTASLNWDTDIIDPTALLEVWKIVCSTLDDFLRGTQLKLAFRNLLLARRERSDFSPLVSQVIASTFKKSVEGQPDPTHFTEFLAPLPRKLHENEFVLIMKSRFHRKFAGCLRNDLTRRESHVQRSIDIANQALKTMIRSVDPNAGFINLARHNLIMALYYGVRNGASTVKKRRLSEAIDQLMKLIQESVGHHKNSAIKTASKLFPNESWPPMNNDDLHLIDEITLEATQTINSALQDDFRDAGAENDIMPPSHDLGEDENRQLPAQTIPTSLDYFEMQDTHDDLSLINWWTVFAQTPLLIPF